MVSRKGASAGHWDFQRRDKCGGDSSRADRSMDHRTLRVALGLCDYRLAGLRLARLVACALSKTGGASTLFQGRAPLHPGRYAAAGSEDQMVAAPSVPADLGVRRRKIPDRPDLVVLSFLGARFSRTPAWGAPGANWAPDRCDLSHFRYWQRSRRVVVIVFDSAGNVLERGTQDRHARVCDQHRPHRVCLPRVRVVAGGVADWSGGGGPPGLFRESVHADFRFVSVAGGGLRGRDRRNGGCGGRGAPRQNPWLRSTVDRQLHGSVLDCRLRVFG